MEMPVDHQFNLKTEVKTEDYEDYYFHSEEVLDDEEKQVDVSESKDDFSLKCEFKEKLQVGIVLLCGYQFLKLKEMITSNSKCYW